MPNLVAAAGRPTFSPLDPARRSLAWQVGAVAIGSLVLTASSYVEVPMFPVPMTMQTFAVLLVGALYGARLGGATILAWLLQALVGLPVLAGGAGGPLHFIGPTAGYLVSFLVIGTLMGGLAERGWNGRRPGLAFLGMLLGHALCLTLGALWLAGSIGQEQAIAFGVVPFLLGSVVKSALGALVLRAVGRVGQVRAA